MPFVESFSPDENHCAKSYMKKFRRFLSNDPSWNPLEVFDKFQLRQSQRNRIWPGQLSKLRAETSFTAALNSDYTEDRENGPHGVSAHKFRELSLVRQSFRSGTSFICCVELDDVKAKNPDQQQVVELFKNTRATNYIWVEARSKTIQGHFGRQAESDELFEIIDLTSSVDRSRQIFAEAPIDDIIMIISFQESPKVNVIYRDDVFNEKQKGKSKKLVLTKDFEAYFQPRSSLIEENQPSQSGLHQSPNSKTMPTSQLHYRQSSSTPSSSTQSSSTQSSSTQSSSTQSSISQSFISQSETQQIPELDEQLETSVERQPNEGESLKEPNEGRMTFDKKWVRVMNNGKIIKFPIVSSEHFDTDNITFPTNKEERRAQWNEIMWNYTSIFDLIEKRNDLSSLFFMTHKEAMQDKKMKKRIDQYYRTMLGKSPPEVWSLVLFSKENNHFTGKLALKYELFLQQILGLVMCCQNDGPHPGKFYRSTKLVPFSRSSRLR